MPAPTIVSYTDTQATAGTTVAPATGRTTASIAVLTGDVVVVWGGAEDSGNAGTLTLSLQGGLTGTLTEKQRDQTTNYSPGVISTAPVTASGSLTAQVVGNGVTGLRMNVGAWVLRNHGGVGVSGKSHQVAATAPSLVVAGVSDLSCLLCLVTDWSAQNAARTYTQVNGANPIERGHFADGSSWHYDAFDYADAGAAGSKTVGQSAPAAQTPNVFAVEVLAVAAAAPPVWTPRRMPLGV